MKKIAVIWLSLIGCYGNVSAQKNMVDAGFSKMVFFNDLDNSLTSYVSGPNRLNCFHLGFVHRQKAPFLTTNIALYYTEKEYSAGNGTDFRFVPPPAYQTSPSDYSRSTTYSEKNINVSFSINYMNDMIVSPVIGLGLELGNTPFMKAHYTEGGTFFDRDSIGNMINKHHETTVDQSWKSSYYLNTLTGMFNLGMMFRVTDNWSLGFISSFRGTIFLGGPTASTPYVGGNFNLFVGVYYYLPSKMKTHQNAGTE